tara:strand:- start:138 stop:431 length:294 start_codon:yes stop_codon:yes gene_type:complete
MLAKVAIKATDERVREETFERLTDPAVLAHIALEDTAWSIRKAAVEKLVDHQDVLAKVVIRRKREGAQGEYGEAIRPDRPNSGGDECRSCKDAQRGG